MERPWPQHLDDKEAVKHREEREVPDGHAFTFSPPAATAKWMSEEARKPRYLTCYARLLA